MADMVPDEIEAAEGVRCLRDHAPALAVLGQVGDDALRLPAGLGDLVHHALDARRVDIDDADLGAFLGEAQRAGAPHPGGRRRDDADLALQSHGRSP